MSRKKIELPFAASVYRFFCNLLKMVMFKAFGFEVPEDGVRKGGGIIKEGLK